MDKYCKGNRLEMIKVQMCAQFFISFYDGNQLSSLVYLITIPLYICSLIDVGLIYQHIKSMLSWKPINV